MNTIKKSSDAIRVSTMYGDFYSWKDDLITEQLTKYSAHTRNEIAMLYSIIKSGDAIIDVGGHIGTYSIPFALKVGDGGKVFTFEGNPYNYSLLERNIELNDLSTRVQALNAIVSLDESKTFGMVLPDGGNSGMYFFSADNVKENGSRMVPSVNIDRWYDGLEGQPKVALLKVDVEGAEVEVLRSCERMIKKHKPVLYIEISQKALKRFNHSTSDLHQLLSKAGYRYYKNIGERNSSNDLFEVAKLNNIDDGGAFYDLLAFHTNDPRRPSDLRLWIKASLSRLRIFVRKLARKMLAPFRAR